MLNIANILTLSRIAAIPLVVACFWLDRGWSQWLSMALFVAAGITDYFDGYFARRYHQISRLGRFPGQRSTLDQHEQRCSDQQLVGHRIEEAAEARDLVMAPCEVAVEIVGDAGGDEQRHRQPLRPAAIEPEAGDDQRNRRDARQRQDIGGVEHEIRRTLSAAAEMVMNLLRQGVGDSRHRLDVFQACRTDRPGAAEMVQQRTLACRANARHLVERRTRNVGCTARAMRADGEAVRLVAQAL